MEMELKGGAKCAAPDTVPLEIPGFGPAEEALPVHPDANTSANIENRGARALKVRTRPACQKQKGAA